MIEPKHSDRYSIAVDNKTFVYDSIESIEYQIDNSKIHFVATPSHTSFGIGLRTPLLERWSNAV